MTAFRAGCKGDSERSMSCWSLDSISRLITSMTSMALGIGALALLFRLLPYRTVPWLHAVIGGAFAAVFMVIGSVLYGWYLSRYGTTSASGVAGSIGLFLVWVYYQAQILLAGAELTKVLGLRSGVSAG